MALAGAGFRHLPIRRVDVQTPHRPSRHCVALSASAFNPSQSHHQEAKSSNLHPPLFQVFLGLVPRARGLLGRSRLQLFVAGGAAQALAGGQGPPDGGPSGGGSSGGGGGSGGDGSFSSCASGGASNVLADVASSESTDMVEAVILLDVGGKRCAGLGTIRVTSHS